jgi:hypothetical protein
MEAYFAELGRNVYARWKAANFSATEFPEIARSALEKNAPAKHVDLDKLIRGFLLQDEQPFQTSSGFGQPELIVYDNPRFYIQLLFWLDGTTDIHQHGFSGAFHVMEGSSIHSRFDFVKEHPVTAHFRLGDLVLRETHLLETGSTVPITSGHSCIHSLFHLDTPSVTVVVRTHYDPGTGPQFTYLPPHVALDPVHHDALTMRRKQLLDVLERTGSPDYPGLVLRMIGELDFERGFFILQNCVGHLRSLGAWGNIWKAFERRHGHLAAQAGASLEEIIRRDAIAALRGTVEEVEHRFFLALLLNVPGRKEILAFIAQRHDGDPIGTILRWAEELTQLTESGTWILDARFPRDLEYDEEDQPALFLAALSFFLKGGKAPKELHGMSAGELKALRDAFATSSWRALLAPPPKRRASS